VTAGKIATQDPQVHPLSPSRGIAQNATWALAGNALYALSQWGMLIALVKLGGPSSAGQFTLALAICSPAFVFANLQLRGVQATDTKASYLLQDYLGLRLGTTFLALLAISCIAVASGNRGTALLVVVAVGCAKGLEAGSDLLFGYLQKHERMDRIATSMMLKGLLSVLAVWLGYLVWHNLLAALWLICFVWAGLLVGVDLVNCIRIRRIERDDASKFCPRFDSGRLKQLTILLGPIGLATILNSLTANVPRFAIERHAGTHLLGLFGGLYYIQGAVVSLAAAIGQASAPRLARHRGAGDKQAFFQLLVRLLGFAGVVGILVSLGAYFAGRSFLSALYTPEYGQYSFELFLLMIAAAVSMQVAILNDCVLVMRLMREQAVIFAATLCCTVVACSYTVERYGLKGVAAAIILVSIVQLMAMASLVGVHLRAPWPAINRV
jgi:O-antigen/teichoic acid export membrane protein